MSSRSLIALILGCALIAGCDRHKAAPEQANTASAAAQAMPDEMPATPSSAPASAPAKSVVDRGHKGEAAPAIGFADPQDKQVTIASFKGKPVLVNLWATWCAPCVAEMPTLDKLAAAQAGKLAVLTVSQDLDGQAKVLPFFEQHGFKTIKPYIDAQASLSIAYKANLPTTILYDASGKEVWRVTGGMDWTGKEAEGLLGEVR